VSDEFRQDMPGFALYVAAAGLLLALRQGVLSRYRGRRASLNVAQLIGHGTLRLAVMGFARPLPRRKSLVAMRA